MYGVAGGFSGRVFCCDIGHSGVHDCCRVLSFKKAGEKPGKLFIPVYGAYLRFELFYDGSMFWAMFVLSILGNLFGSFLGASAAAVISLLVSGFALVINILYCVSLARSFGKSGGFAVGLIFLYPIFASILAFGKAQYGGERRANLKGVTGWRCECGNMNSPGSTVCDRCGAEKKKLPETT